MLTNLIVYFGAFCILLCAVFLGVGLFFSLQGIEPYFRQRQEDEKEIRVLKQEVEKLKEKTGV